MPFDWTLPRLARRLRPLRHSSRSKLELLAAQADQPSCRFEAGGIKSFDAKLNSAGLPGIVALIEHRLEQHGRCRVFEPGCGDGRLLLELLAVFGERVELHGSSNPNSSAMAGGEMLLRTNELYGVIDPARLASLPLPTIHGADLQDMRALPVRDFDLILSQGVVPHVVDKARALEQSARLLVPGGIFVHELDCFDMPPLDFLDTDLPRFTIYRGGRRVSTSKHLRACGVELLTFRRKAVMGLLAVHRGGKPFSLGLELNRKSTLKLQTIASCDAPLDLWGVRSVYHAK